MSELDKKRIKGFLENIKNNQVLITGTDNLEIENARYNSYRVENGEVFNV